MRNPLLSHPTILSKKLSDKKPKLKVFANDKIAIHPSFFILILLPWYLLHFTKSDFDQFLIYQCSLLHIKNGSVINTKNCIENTFQNEPFVKIVKTKLEIDKMWTCYGASSILLVIFYHKRSLTLVHLSSKWIGVPDTRHSHETLSLWGKSTLKNLFPLFSLALFFLRDGLFEEVCATFVLEMLPATPIPWMVVWKSPWLTLSEKT